MSRYTFIAMAVNKDLIEVSKEVFSFLVDYLDSGMIESSGTFSGENKGERLLAHLVQEGINILRHESETVGMELYGGHARLDALVYQTSSLPEHLKPELERVTPYKPGNGRAAKTIKVPRG